MADFKIGKVTHFYDKIGVAVIALEDDLSVGDTIKFVRGGEDLFTQKVESIQMEHQNIDKAGKGQEVGLKVDEEAKDGSEVYKVS
ncbi:translation elongation factor-like protein [Candidatus Microgenomates bacterium]|nr:translation elongation factor-like protein [Candidatus Microgenomates bacterium]